MIRLKRPSPLVQMTLALVTMTISIVLLADLMLGITGHREQERHLVRQQLAESLAVQAAVLLQADDPDALERTMSEVLLRVRDLRSIGLRRTDGTLVMGAGPHDAAWRRADDRQSTADQVRVPLSANDLPWGTVEVSFHAKGVGWWARLLESPLARLLLFVGVVGSIGYAMYMRRALQHLDPAAVIPERVQRAFDAIAEGVVVLDARARVMLANHAFRGMSGGGRPLSIGQTLSSVDWLAAALPSDVSTHPWMRAMAERRNTFNDTLVVPAAVNSASTSEADDRNRSLVVSCAPIADTGGAVRGCMVTLNDMTELHRVNSALTQTMQALEASRAELRRNNQQLQRLATRDPLTGCLNRRAFMDLVPRQVAQAQDAGSALGCLMLDIDHFKSINDTYGHGIGDRVIAEVAKTLLEAGRKGDLVCRYGGEEFCIVGPGRDAESTLALGEAIRARVEASVGAEIAKTADVPGLRVTISVGASGVGDAEDTLAALIDRADQALYSAKRGGRNRVVQFTDMPCEATEAAA